MKLPNILHNKHTIAGRLTWRVVGWITIVMSVILAMVFGFIWAVGVAGMSSYYELYMELYDEKINNVFTTVEIALSNNVPEVEENIDKKNREYFAVEHLLRAPVEVQQHHAAVVVSEPVEFADAVDFLSAVPVGTDQIIRR